METQLTESQVIVLNAAVANREKAIKAVNDLVGMFAEQAGMDPTRTNAVGTEAGIVLREIDPPKETKEEND